MEINEKDLNTLIDLILQIYSLSEVASNYADTFSDDEKMLHIGLMMDKIHEQAARVKTLAQDSQLLP